MTFAPISLPALMPAVIAALIGWRIYRRVRRLIGRQPMRPRRLIMTMIFFPILLVLASLSGLRNPVMFEAIAAGVVIGLALSVLGFRLTRFETADSRFYYIPNVTIGVGISLLFIGRLIYRFGVLYFSTGTFDPSTMQTFGSSPLTLGIFGVVASYYTGYAAGLMIWYRKHQHEIALPIPPADVTGT